MFNTLNYDKGIQNKWKFLAIYCHNWLRIKPLEMTNENYLNIVKMKENLIYESDMKKMYTIIRYNKLLLVTMGKYKYIL